MLSEKVNVFLLEYNLKRYTYQFEFVSGVFFGISLSSSWKIWIPYYGKFYMNKKSMRVEERVFKGEHLNRFQGSLRPPAGENNFWAERPGHLIVSLEEYRLRELSEMMAVLYVYQHISH